MRSLKSAHQILRRVEAGGPTAVKVELPRGQTILSGQGSLQLVGSELAAKGLRDVLIITSPSVGSLAGVKEVQEALGEVVLDTISNVSPHPTKDFVRQLVDGLPSRSVGAILAIGGGSVIDSAKLVALDLAYGDPRKSVPVWACPTTLSAAEWNGIAGSVDSATRLKTVVRHPELTPSAVFLDPSLASTTPKSVWASTGVRALDHAVETLYSPATNPLATQLALGALEILAVDLPRSVRNPSDLDSVLRCQWAAMMSIALVHSVPLGLSHAIGHQLGAFGVPHGVTSCLMLPHVMRFMLPISRKQQKLISTALGAPDADRAAEEVSRLIVDLGCPTRLRDISPKVERSTLRSIASATVREYADRESRLRVDESVVVALLDAAW